MNIETYVSIKPVRPHPEGAEFQKGTEWEGVKHNHLFWKLRVKGTSTFHFFAEESMKKYFKKKGCEA